MKPKTAKVTENTHYLGVMISTFHRHKLAEIAKTQNRTMSGVVRELIKKEIRKYENGIEKPGN